MERPYDIEIEPEVREWLDALPREHYRAVERHADHLGDGTVRLTCLWAQQECEGSHAAAQTTYHRTFEESP
ncbi:hypothetical protein B7755_028470 [Streptomyces sp. NBS 14/10]|uniref:hypothetical protein n=1 Tax=Streptomyces sp. NBS 14/10 TaxID=1945643 RepID=UPI000D1BD55B|nr:hypothetical protein [Streptomyces sp. NBS 14/10]KAK1181733.1 hypothetical protein B7755_028470 [Streptomyces sp. NBS 14/10]